MPKSSTLWARLAICCLIAGLWAAPASAEFTDDSHQVITLGEPRHRIISLYGAHTENLFSLGLGDRIVGVSSSEDFPRAALEKPVFSHRDDPEKFIAARPDLVLVRPMIFNGYRRLVGQLLNAGIPVVSLQPGDIEGMYEYWRRLGLLTERAQRAERMISDFKSELSLLMARTEALPRSDRKRVFFESIHSKMKTFTPTAMPIFALRTAGGVNVAEDARGRRGTNIAEYGHERILFHAGEIEVYLAQQGPMNPITVNQILNEAGFGAIRAVKNRQVFLIDERIISRPTMRLLRGIAKIGRILYPDRFPTKSQNKDAS